MDTITLTGRQKALQDRLLSSPETVMIDLHGEQVPFLLTDLAAEWAESHHEIDPVQSLSRLLRRLFDAAGPILGGLRGATGEDDGTTRVLLSTIMKALPSVLDRETLNDFGNVVFWGVLFFDPSLTRGDVVMTRSFIMANAAVIFNAATGWGGGDEPTVADQMDEEEGAEKNV